MLEWAVFENQKGKDIWQEKETPSTYLIYLLRKLSLAIS